MRKLAEIKERVQGNHVGIYDGVCKLYDLKWLIKHVEQQQKEIESLKSILIHAHEASNDDPAHRIISEYLDEHADKFN